MTSAGSIAMDVLKAAGQISITGNLSGDIQTTNNLAGDVVIGVAAAPSDLTATGSIDVGGALKGDIVITGDVDHNSSETSISANKLDVDGRILIDGTCDSDVVVNKGTNSTSLIRMGVGLDDNGTIVINDGAGDFDADGDIWIGDPNWCGACELIAVTFDGCIRVKEDPGPPPAGGDLNGDITVVGCHDTSAALNICIDGSENGSITIEQTGCDPQVTVDCDDDFPPA